MELSRALHREAAGHIKAEEPHAGLAAYRHISAHVDLRELPRAVAGVLQRGMGSHAANSVTEQQGVQQHQKRSRHEEPAKCGDDSGGRWIHPGTATCRAFDTTENSREEDARRAKEDAHDG